MEASCVRVPREDGERTRRELVEAGLVDDRYEITVEEGWLYVPVTDPDAASEALEWSATAVTREVTARDSQDTPADLLEFEPSYERLGDVAIVDEDDPDRAARIATAIVDSDLPVATVLNRASKIKGQRRVRDWELLAGDSTETVHREYGLEYALDLSEVYFSPRLATERHRVAQQVEADERAFDTFAGVGPYAVPFARRGAEVVAVDVNGRAIEYLRENCRRNGVADRVTAVHGDVRDVAPDSPDWADRIVMNLPHSADEFLETAVSVAGDDCVVHYYDIQHEDDPYGPGERAIREAAAPDYEVTVETRHTVRSYAPHELNVCLDVRLVRTE
jgi:tRNA (guanine37-N1)-methyltransferase